MADNKVLYISLLYMVLRKKNHVLSAGQPQVEYLLLIHRLEFHFPYHLHARRYMPQYPSRIPSRIAISCLFSPAALMLISGANTRP